MFFILSPYFYTVNIYLFLKGPFNSILGGICVIESEGSFQSFGPFVKWGNLDYIISKVFPAPISYDSEFTSVS